MQAGASVNLVSTTGANGSTPPAAPPASPDKNGPDYHCFYELADQCWFAQKNGVRPKTAQLCRRSHLVDGLHYDDGTHQRLVNFAKVTARKKQTNRRAFPLLQEHLVARLTGITSTQVQEILQAQGQATPATTPAPASGAASSPAGSTVNVNALGTPPPTAAQMVWKMIAKESTSHVDVKWVTAYDGYLCHDPTWADSEAAYKYFNSL